MKNYDLERVLEQLKQSKEAAWGQKTCPTFLPRPDSDKSNENLRQYVTGYPWIVIAKDKGRFFHYYCAFCMKVANPFHLLSSDHLNRTVHNFSAQFSGHMPEWMGKFKGVDTAQILSDYSDTVWPPICEGCNVRPLDSQQSRCHSCRRRTKPRHVQQKIAPLPMARLTPANAPVSQTMVAAQEVRLLTFPCSSDATHTRTSGSPTGQEGADRMTDAESRFQCEIDQDSE